MDLVYALSLDVEYNLFWKLNPKKLSYFVEAHKIKMKNQDFLNYSLGGYIKMGTASLLNKQNKYPSKPFLDDIDKSKEKTIEETQNEWMLKLKAWATIHNANLKKQKSNVNTTVENTDNINNTQ